MEGMSSRATTKSSISVHDAATKSSSKTLAEISTSSLKEKENKEGITIQPFVFNSCFVTTSELDLEDNEIQCRIDTLHPASINRIGIYKPDVNTHSVSLNCLQKINGPKIPPLKDNHLRRKSDLPGLASRTNNINSVVEYPGVVLQPKISIIGGEDDKILGSSNSNKKHTDAENSINNRQSSRFFHGLNSTHGKVIVEFVNE
jgi:hypothetical protein